METGQIQELEALVRWAHPTRGMIPPSSFIPLAEETGVIGAIGRWVLEEACRQAAEWRKALPAAASLVISVNLSARQMEHEGLVEEVGALLASCGLDPSALKLEITESAMMGNVERSIAMLWMLKHLGVRLAIDDFGTGYSSLGYIKRIPADTLKVDKIFVDGLGIHAEDRAIIATIVEFARSVGMTTTVEGVEDEHQFALIRELQADRVQGFYFSRPLAAADVPAALANSPRQLHHPAPGEPRRAAARAA